MLHVLAVLPFQVRFAVAEKREQGESRDAGVGPCAGALAIVIERARLAARAVGIGVPAAVGRLVGGEPVEGRGHGRLGLRRGPELLGHLEPIGHDAGPQRLGHGLPVAQAAAALSASVAANDWPVPASGGSAAAAVVFGRLAAAACGDAGHTRRRLGRLAFVSLEVFGKSSVRSPGSSVAIGVIAARSAGSIASAGAGAIDGSGNCGGGCGGLSAAARWPAATARPAAAELSAAASAGISRSIGGGAICGPHQRRRRRIQIGRVFEPSLVPWLGLADLRMRRGLFAIARVGHIDLHRLTKQAARLFKEDLRAIGVDQQQRMCGERQACTLGDWPGLAPARPDHDHQRNEHRHEPERQHNCQRAVGHRRPQRKKWQRVKHQRVLLPPVESLPCRTEMPISDIPAWRHAVSTAATC